MLLYANDNRGQYPPTPDLLLLTQDIAPDAFCCPASDETPVSANLVQTARSTPNTALLTQGNTSYVYVGKGQTSSSSAEAILAYEMPANHDDDGCNFLYGDGHVSFELKASADAIIAEINAGNNPPRWNVVQQAVRNSRAKRRAPVRTRSNDCEAQSHVRADAPRGQRGNHQRCRALGALGGGR